MILEEPRPKLFTREQYAEMKDMGWFADSPVELQAGAIVDLSPSAQQPSLHRFTTDEFYNMAELGWFGEKRVELIEGELVEMSPPLHNHVYIVNAITRIFTRALPDIYFVSCQNPIHFGTQSNPQPDFAVIKGAMTNTMPTHAELIIEVSDTTLRYDQTKKASNYAGRGILDYWIVNVDNRVVEVYRDPVRATGFFFGYKYANKTIYHPGDTIVPLNIPELSVQVDAILP